MSLKQLEKLYPEYFATVESAVWESLRIAAKIDNRAGKNNLTMLAKTARSIARNAAFVATRAHHMALTGK